jgi:hypothetical protein
LYLRKCGVKDSTVRDWFEYDTEEWLYRMDNPQYFTVEEIGVLAQLGRCEPYELFKRAWVRKIADSNTEREIKAAIAFNQAIE